MFPSLELFGTSISMYSAVNHLATVAQVLVLLLTLRDYKSFCTFPILTSECFFREKKNKSTWLWVFVFVEAVLVLLFHVLIGQKLGPLLSKIFLGQSADNFVSNIYPFPILFVLTAILLKTSPLKALDYTAPIQIIGLIFFKIACFCCGCCYGYECASPFYNQTNQRYEMPVQLIELACAILMFAIILIMRKRRHKPGLLYATFMLMYCGTRFCSEFLRDDFPPVLGRMNGYHIQLIIGFLLGAISLLIVLKFSDRITAYFESKNLAFLDLQLEKLKEREQIRRKNRLSRQKQIQKRKKRKNRNKKR